MTADSEEGVLRAIDEWKLSFVVVFDPERKTVSQYGVINPVGGVTVPSTFVIDRQGIVRYRHIGTSSADRPDVGELLEAVRNIAGVAKP